jgi:hypothetical protein
VKFFWHWWRENPASESEELLEELCARDEEIEEIGEQLRKARARNHFSELVNQAISARAAGGA